MVGGESEHHSRTQMGFDQILATKTPHTEAMALQQALELERKENEKLRADLDDCHKKIEHFERREVTDYPSNLYEQLLSRVESPALLQQLEQLKRNGSPVAVSDEEHASTKSADCNIVAGIDDPNWWMWVTKDLFGSESLEEDDYVIVTEEDIIDGIVTFMAKYVATIPEAKNMTPLELQKTICEAFKKIERKGCLHKLWRLGKFLYTVASWGATGIGLLRQPLLLRAALLALSTSMRLLFRVIV